MNHRELIGQRIAQLRKKKGFTILELSEMTGLDNSNIGKIEKGKYNVGIDILGKIADALMVEINFKGIDCIMRIEERLTALAEGEPCFIQREIEENEEATMYHFICGIIESACIVYNDGTLFHQWDWQGGRPNSAEEIEDFKWIREDGVEAINIKGLPRVLE